MNIRPVEAAELFHAYGRTDMTKLTLFNTQNVMETRLAKLYHVEAAEFENDTEIFSLALVFELQLWPEISLFFSQLNFRSLSSKFGNTLNGRRNSHTTMK